MSILRRNFLQKVMACTGLVLGGSGTRGGQSPPILPGGLRNMILRKGLIGKQGLIRCLRSQRRSLLRNWRGEGRWAFQPLK
jgi:hypothetical protein